MAVFTAPLVVARRHRAGSHPAACQRAATSCKPAPRDLIWPMKKKPPIRPPSPSSASSPGAHLPPSHEEIARQAEALWREKGCPHGRDDEIWLEAEQQLLRLPVI